MHPTWAGDLFHPRYCTCFEAVLLKHPTLSFSHKRSDLVHWENLGGAGGEGGGRGDRDGEHM